MYYLVTACSFWQLSSIALSGYIPDFLSHFTHRKPHAQTANLRCGFLLATLQHKDSEWSPVAWRSPIMGTIHLDTRGIVMTWATKSDGQTVSRLQMVILYSCRRLTPLWFWIDVRSSFLTSSCNFPFGGLASTTLSSHFPVASVFSETNLRGNRGMSWWVPASERMRSNEKPHIRPL